MAKPQVHLLVNESSGTGHAQELVAHIRELLAAALGEVSSSVVFDHPSAAERARGLVAGSSAPMTLFVGGGGGTLRAVIEGVAAASNGRGFPGEESLRLAPLRMGSGNLLAKELGVPKDPVAACARLVAALKAGRLSRRPIGRYDFEREGGGVETRYAASLAGFGGFGRVPGDLERWHQRCPRLRRGFGALVGLEHWNDVEYAVATFLRTAGAAFVPRSIEEVEVRSGERSERMRLLAGVVMSFPIARLPFDPGRLGEERLSLHLVPYRSRRQAATLVLAPRRYSLSAVRFEIEPPRSVEIRLRDRERVEMFLDEDPIELYRKVTVSVVGRLAFVTARES